jgi:hypothetical protein
MGVKISVSNPPFGFLIYGSCTRTVNFITHPLLCDKIKGLQTTGIIGKRAVRAQCLVLSIEIFNKAGGTYMDDFFRK